MTLPDIIATQRKNFGLRNATRFHSLNQRIDFLFVAAGDFKKLVRKEEKKGLLASALARILSRIICVSDFFGEYLPLAECFAEKWLNETCRYCHRMPCECRNQQRPEPILENNRHIQFWDLRKVSDHIDKLYGATNKLRSIDELYARLVEEISEIIGVVVNMPQSQRTNEEELRELALELSDAIAWVIAISNYLEIDLLEAYLDRYGNGCTKCNSSPCQCGSFAWPTTKDWASTQIVV